MRTEATPQRSVEVVVDSQDVAGMDVQTLPATESQVEDMFSKESPKESPKEPLGDEKTPSDMSQRATSPAGSLRSLSSTGDSNGNVAEQSEHQLNS